MDSESGIFSMIFDQSGSRLITTEADKTIKIYKEDDTAVRMIIKYTVWTVVGQSKSDVDPVDILSIQDVPIHVSQICYLRFSGFSWKSL